jgi:hypothetical protein
VTIQDLGSIGELIAAIATVATLVYLAIQIRQNTISVQASTLQSSIEFSTGFVESLYRDPELALLFERGREEQETLSAAERARFSLVMLGLGRIAQVLHHQFEQGLMSEDIWNGYRESLLGWLAQPGSRQWWRGNGARFSASFRAYSIAS